MMLGPTETDTALAPWLKEPPVEPLYRGKVVATSLRLYAKLTDALTSDRLKSTLTFPITVL
jgi:hypothetical protein